MSERQSGTCISNIGVSHRARYNFAAKFLPKKATVLDVFCGVGYGSNLLANAGAIVTAFDKSKEAIESARTNFSHPSLTFICSPFSNIDLPERHFNFVTCFEAIEHTDAALALLAFINSWMSDKAQLFISTPNQLRLPFNKSRWPYHSQHFTPDELEEILNSTGFRVTNWYSQERKGTSFFKDGTDGDFIMARCLCL